MKKNITDIKFKGLKVILRCDFNVPIKDGVITDDTRIKSSLETIEFLMYGGAKIIILSHLGRVKEEADKLKYSLLPVSKRLGELLNREVVFVPYTRGNEVETAVNNMKNGDILIILPMMLRLISTRSMDLRISNLHSNWVLTNARMNRSSCSAAIASAIP